MIDIRVLVNGYSSMSNKQSYFTHNYPLVIKYLKDNDIPYEEYNNGLHLKIAGATLAFELWPSQMKYHIMFGEDSGDYGYYQLDYYFDEEQFDKLVMEGKR